MAALRIRNIRTLVSCDDRDRVDQNVDLFAQDGVIRRIGSALNIAADRTIGASNRLCYPGLVNTRRHLYQIFSRNLPEVQSLELVGGLFDPKSVLAAVGLRGAVDYTVVNGVVTVARGRLVRTDKEVRAARAAEKCAAYLGRL